MDRWTYPYHMPTPQCTLCILIAALVLSLLYISTRNFATRRLDKWPCICIFYYWFIFHIPVFTRFYSFFFKPFLFTLIRSSFPASPSILFSFNIWYICMYVDIHLLHLYINIFGYYFIHISSTINWCFNKITVSISMLFHSI